jgi:hypothetical protein
MILKKWENIPDNIKNEKTKEYYDILNSKKITLFLKRLFDIIFSTILLIVLSPILIILAIAIKIDSKGPIFYRQERITQYGKIFKIFKFRTMIFNADKIGALVTTKNDSRITRVGNIIRKCRLDEIPQLINILVGDMTFVGTRPEVKKYVERYTDEMKATLLMPAGVTSIASIKYKNEDEIIGKYIEQGEDIDDIYVNRVLPEKMKYNVDYVKKFTIFQDILICVQTVNEVLKIQNTKESTNKKQNSKEKINK